MVKEERWYPPCLNETDNGTEFTAPWNSLEKTLFTKIIECSLTSTHKTIPAGAKTYQSDVESSHRLIEDEFYACRYFSSALIFYSCGGFNTPTLASGLLISVASLLRIFSIIAAAVTRLLSVLADSINMQIKR